MVFQLRSIAPKMWTHSVRIRYNCTCTLNLSFRPVNETMCSALTNCLLGLLIIVLFESKWELKRSSPRSNNINNILTYFCTIIIFFALQPTVWWAPSIEVNRWELWTRIIIRLAVKCLPSTNTRFWYRILRSTEALRTRFSGPELPVGQVLKDLF